MNYLKAIDVRTFSTLKSLTELELKYNLLTEIDPKLFINTKLKELSLDFNNITKIDVVAINKLSLERFTIENNSIRLNITLANHKLSKPTIVISLLKEVTLTYSNFLP